MQRELAEGRKLEPECDEARRRAGRAAVRAGMSFGYVERRDVELRRIRLVLGRATTCRRWPLRDAAASVLRRDDVSEAGCSTRRARNPVAITLVPRAGEAVTIEPLAPDGDGAVALSFSRLDLELRALGHGTLDDFIRIEIGEQAWAGTVDLEQLRSFRAQWHLAWVRRGRGVPGLFAARYPRHPGAEEARALDADANLQRQRRAADHVRDGHLTPRHFLQRYPDSPFRRVVESATEVSPGRAAISAAEVSLPPKQPASESSESSEE